MDIVNLSIDPFGRVISWLPSSLRAKHTIFLPDACPGKSPLPTGCVVKTSQPDWRRYAISDCGCGMRLLKSNLSAEEVTSERWDALASSLRENRGGLGDLGGGNHFLDALRDYATGEIFFLIHTGSRKESGLVDDLVNAPGTFETEFSRIVQWAEDNRGGVQNAIEGVFGRTEIVLDLPHNTFELLDDGQVIIRKGAVRVMPGDLAVIPSHMSGDVALVRATEKVKEICCSLSHGTGRAMSRSECKERFREYDFSELRQKVLLPTSLSDGSLRTEGPYAYRELDDCLLLLDGYVEVRARFDVVGYMGHL